MRIAHVISSPSGIGGAERVLLDLVRGGEERGWDQRVLNPFSNGSALAESCPAGTYVDYAAARLREVPRARAWVHDELARFRPEIVHVHLFHALVVVSSLPRPGGARLVLTHHHGSRYVDESQVIRERVDRVCGRRYDTVVAVSEPTHRMLTERYRYPDHKVCTIPNGWSGFPQHKAGEPGHKVICVANFRPQKGHDVLLAAFALVAKTLPDAELVLAGDGPLRGDVEALARSLGVARQVQFRGHVDEIWPLLADADVFVLASRYEPLGIAVLEAMAAGLPVVASAVGGLRELVDPGVNGYLVAPENSAELAARVGDLLAHPERVKAMGDASRERAETHRADEMTRRYFELYEGLLADTRVAGNRTRR